MIKYIFLNFFFMSLASASILISSFDAFDGAQGNNSQVVAKRLIESLKKTHPQLIIKHCELRVVYDKSVETLKDCYAQMEEKPKFIISLGEGGCKNLKIETRALNLDHDFTSDNDGVHRENESIVEGAIKYQALSFNWAQAYCTLTNKEKRKVELSNDAGSFVCNHLSYKMRYEFPKISFAFAHVPAFNCASKHNLEKASQTLEKLVISIYEKKSAYKLEPISRSEVAGESQKRSCEAQFYQILLKKYN